jgi:hypothetical protein
MTAHRITLPLVATAIALLLAAVPVALGQGTAPPQLPASALNRQATIDAMQAMNKELDDLVAAMNAATGSAKVDRIAAVVTALVAAQKRTSAIVAQDPMMPRMMPDRPAPSPQQR